MRSNGGGGNNGILLLSAVQDEGEVVFGRLFDGGSIGEPQTIAGAGFSLFAMVSGDIEW